MHSFNENPPKSFDDVYKVYYSWRITRGEKDEFGRNANQHSVFSMPVDECSALEHLEYDINDMLEQKKKKIDVFSFGQPGSMWTIIYHPHRIFSDDGEEIIDEENGVLLFQVFDNYTNAGYRFDLEVKEAKALSKLLTYVGKRRTYLKRFAYIVQIGLHVMFVFSTK